MIVNVCPSGVGLVTPERVWQILATPERFAEWLEDAELVGVHPEGPASPGQRIELAARGFGFRWKVVIEVQDVDPYHHWIDLVVHLPFGIVNNERVTLTEMEGRRTLVRFN